MGPAAAGRADRVRFHRRRSQGRRLAQTVSRAQHRRDHRGKPVRHAGPLEERRRVPVLDPGREGHHPAGLGLRRGHRSHEGQEGRAGLVRTGQLLQGLAGHQRPGRPAGHPHRQGWKRRIPLGYGGQEGQPLQVRRGPQGKEDRPGRPQTPLPATRLPGSSWARKASTSTSTSAPPPTPAATRTASSA